MKLPRKVIIAGQEWRVIKEPKEYGGRLEALELTMWIGTKRKCHIFPTFLHEVFEAICIMRDVRYSGHTEGDYLFSMNHEEFEHALHDLGLALKDVLRR